MMVPARMCKIRSASTMVLRRCAITKLVRPCMSVSIACTMSRSVRVSTLDVASSKMRIAGLHRITRAMVSS